jgi:hypothetical protein
MLKNQNLNLNILSYLEVKDLSKLEQVSKKFNNLAKKFPEKWKHECHKIFRSDYFNYSILDEASFLEEIPLETFNTALSVDYKKLLTRGIMAVTDWDLFGSTLSKTNFINIINKNDILELKKELFSIFKGK